VDSVLTAVGVIIFAVFGFAAWISFLILRKGRK
jgi:hypothetical protein